MRLDATMERQCLSITSPYDELNKTENETESSSYRNIFLWQLLLLLLLLPPSFRRSRRIRKRAEPYLPLLYRHFRLCLCCYIWLSVMYVAVSMNFEFSGCCCCCCATVCCHFGNWFFFSLICLLLSFASLVGLLFFVLS